MWVKQRKSMFESSVYHETVMITSRGKLCQLRSVTPSLSYRSTVPMKLLPTFSLDFKQLREGGTSKDSPTAEPLSSRSVLFTSPPFESRGKDIVHPPSTNFRNWRKRRSFCYQDGRAGVLINKMPRTIVGGSRYRMVTRA